MTDELQQDLIAALRDRVARVDRAIGHAALAVVFESDDPQQLSDLLDRLTDDSLDNATALTLAEVAILAEVEEDVRVYAAYLDMMGPDAAALAEWRNGQPEVPGRSSPILGGANELDEILDLDEGEGHDGRG